MTRVSSIGLILTPCIPDRTQRTFCDDRTRHNWPLPGIARRWLYEIIWLKAQLRALPPQTLRARRNPLGGYSGEVLFIWKSLRSGY